MIVETPRGPSLAGTRITVYSVMDLIKWLVDFALPPNYPDQDIWRLVQERGFLLITSNRNREDGTSLQATIERENTPESLPVLTVSHRESLLLTEYRQNVAHKYEKSEP